jgi:transcriptional regulator CtsR
METINEEFSELCDKRRELAEEIINCSPSDINFIGNEKYRKLMMQFDSVNEQINEIIGYE